MGGRAAEEIEIVTLRGAAGTSGNQYCTSMVYDWGMSDMAISSGKQDQVFP